MEKKELLPVERKKFEEFLLAAGIIYNHPGLKALTWRPYGLAILNKFTSFLRDLFPRFGYQEHVFPFLTDINNFYKLNRDIYEFDKGVFKVGDAVLRPSGEIVIYPIFKEWIKTTSDLPVKVFQIGSMFRNGRRAGIFRLNEANFFIEAHSAHASRVEVEKQVMANDSLIDQALHFFGLPVIKIERPVWTNKPVAEKNFGYDAILPNGETALAASSYAQMQIFSKVFGVQFLDQNSNYDYTYQSTFGFSFRPFLFSLWSLSDQLGLCLLPSLAPYQVVITEINADSNLDVAEVSQAVEVVQKKLTAAGINSVVDRDFRLPLVKRFSKWELLGVPIRIEIGSYESTLGILRAKCRDNFSVAEIAFSEAGEKISGLLNQIEQRLRQKLLASFANSQVEARNHLEVQELLTSQKVAQVSICYSPACINGLQKNVGRGELLGVTKTTEENVCLVCNKTTNYRGYYSRRI